MWSVRVSFSLNDSGRLFLLCSSLPSEGRWRLTTEDDAPGPHGGDWEIDDSDHPSEQGRDQNGEAEKAQKNKIKVLQDVIDKLNKVTLDCIAESENAFQENSGEDLNRHIWKERRYTKDMLRARICGRLLLQSTGDMAAEKIPKDVKNLWEEWNIRVLIIFSLSLQSILVVFSPSRKRTSGKLFVFLIWFAYLLADWSANYTIGQISDTQDEEDGDQGWTLCALLAPMNDVRSKRSE
ncbi:BnaC01g30790D [Brassica napus]|uniref:BnaC01g30790D protein n=1 Tax=Brassica napus TaxID=3708 RepID=A0A078F7C5_BRANA|nr:BnaC01g30790D [Brassica napus]